jgi:hypothetical protein
MVGYMAERLRERERPLFFSDLARDVGDGPWRDLLRACGEVRGRFPLEWDEEGRCRNPPVGEAVRDRKRTAGGAGRPKHHPAPRSRGGRR